MSEVVLTELNTTKIEFTVYGQPQSAGSKRAFPFRKRNGGLGVAVSDDNPKSAGWKDLVAAAAQQHRPRKLIEGPISVLFSFVRVRPGGHFNTKGKLNKKGRAALRPTTKPDVLKLARAVEDALTGIVWKDDAQIVDESLEKIWGDAPCVRVVVESIPNEF